MDSSIQKTLFDPFQTVRDACKEHKGATLASSLLGLTSIVSIVAFPILLGSGLPLLQYGSMGCLAISFVAGGGSSVFAFFVARKQGQVVRIEPSNSSVIVQSVPAAPGDAPGESFLPPESNDLYSEPPEDGVSHDTKPSPRTPVVPSDSRQSLTEEALLSLQQWFREEGEGENPPSNAHPVTRPPQNQGTVSSSPWNPISDPYIELKSEDDGNSTISEREDDDESLTSSDESTTSDGSSSSSESTHKDVENIGAESFASSSSTHHFDWEAPNLSEMIALFREPSSTSPNECNDNEVPPPSPTASEVATGAARLIHIQQQEAETSPLISFLKSLTSLLGSEDQGCKAVTELMIALVHLVEKCHNKSAGDDTALQNAIPQLLQQVYPLLGEVDQLHAALTPNETECAAGGASIAERTVSTGSSSPSLSELQQLWQESEQYIQKSETQAAARIACIIDTVRKIDAQIKEEQLPVTIDRALLPVLKQILPAWIQPLAAPQPGPVSDASGPVPENVSKWLTHIGSLIKVLTDCAQEVIAQRPLWLKQSQRLKDIATALQATAEPATFITLFNFTSQMPSKEVNEKNIEAIIARINGVALKQERCAKMLSEDGWQQLKTLLTRLPACFDQASIERQKAIAEVKQCAGAICFGGDLGWLIPKETKESSMASLLKGTARVAVNRFVARKTINEVLHGKITSLFGSVGKILPKSLEGLITGGVRIADSGLINVVLALVDPNQKRRNPNDFAKSTKFLTGLNQAIQKIEDAPPGEESAVDSSGVNPLISAIRTNLEQQMKPVS